METLASNPRVFIRPTAAGSALGGVAYATREAMLLCEAAGFDTVIIETVGVGQSEIEVRNMVDFFLLLMLAGAGDELQGIKKGIMEMADLLVINKADGDNVEAAKRAKVEYANALHLFPPSVTGWRTPVLTSSAITPSGLPEIQACVEEYYQHMQESGGLEALRNRQNIQWLHDLIKIFQERWFMDSQGMQDYLLNIEAEVAAGNESPYSAASRLMQFRLNNQ
jgi:LAO/AO transport system kinase